MRYVKCVLIPDSGGLYPLDQRLADDPTITRNLLHNINLLSDDTVVTLFELSGEEARVQDIIDNSSNIITSTTTCTNGTVQAYLHFEPNETLSQLLNILEEYEFMLDTPLVYTDRGGLRVRLIGTQDTIRDALPAVPGDVRVKLEQTGEFAPSADRIFTQLTTCQQETLITAVDVGYYDVPRRTTHGDIADELGLTAGTVGEHLRKIEAQILTQITP